MLETWKKLRHDLRGDLAIHLVVHLVKFDLLFKDKTTKRASTEGEKRLV